MNIYYTDCYRFCLLIFLNGTEIQDMPTKKASLILWVHVFTEEIPSRPEWWQTQFLDAIL